MQIPYNVLQQDAVFQPRLLQRPMNGQSAGLLPLYDQPLSRIMNLTNAPRILLEAKKLTLTKIGFLISVLGILKNNSVFLQLNEFPSSCFDEGIQGPVRI